MKENKKKLTWEGWLEEEKEDGECNYTLTFKSNIIIKQKLSIQIIYSFFYWIFDLECLVISEITTYSGY